MTKQHPDVGAMVDQLDIYQTMLDFVSDAVLRGDGEQYLSASALPYTIQETSVRMLGGGGTQKGFMSFVYGGIVLAIAMVFIVQFRPGSGRETASLTRQCAVTIRDRCIEPKEFLASLGLAAPRGADDDRLRAMQIRRQVAEGLIERTLLVQ